MKRQALHRHHKPSSTAPFFCYFPAGTQASALGHRLGLPSLLTLLADVPVEAPDVPLLPKWLKLDDDTLVEKIPGRRS
jgi:hypothetical protein